MTARTFFLMFRSSCTDVMCVPLSVDLQLKRGAFLDLKHHTTSLQHESPFGHKVIKAGFADFRATMQVSIIAKFYPSVLCHPDAAALRGASLAGCGAQSFMAAMDVGSQDADLFLLAMSNLWTAAMCPLWTDEDPASLRPAANFTLLNTPHIFLCEMVCCEVPRGLRQAMSGHSYASFDLSKGPNAVSAPAHEVQVIVVGAQGYGERHILDLEVDNDVSGHAAERMHDAFVHFLLPFCDELNMVVRRGVVSVTEAMSTMVNGSANSGSVTVNHILDTFTDWRVDADALLALLDAAAQATRRCSGQEHATSASRLREYVLYVSRKREHLASAVADYLIRSGIPLDRLSRSPRPTAYKPTGRPSATWTNCGHCGAPATWDSRLDWASAHKRLRLFPPGRYCHQCWE